MTRKKIEKYVSRHFRRSHGDFNDVLKCFINFSKWILKDKEAENKQLKERIKELESQLNGRVVDIDSLSNILREIDGNHDKGAGCIAEKLLDRLLIIEKEK